MSVAATSTTHFNSPDVVLRNEATKVFLQSFLPDLLTTMPLQTALDVGCGFGFFSGYAGDLGLQVVGLDARPENLEEARRCHPEISFAAYNVEDPAVTGLGTFDLVLCLGVLHHLENPLQAMRNLGAMTGKVLVVETMIAPFRRQLAALYEEESGRHQSVHYIALIPSESWVVKALYRVGFPFVYRPTGAPAHEAFRGSLFRQRTRTLLVAANVACAHPALHLLPEPAPSNQVMWYRAGVKMLLAVRRLARRVQPSG